MLILKKIIFCRNISLVIALWADIFIAYIALKSISTFLRQFYPGGLANFVGYHHLVLHRCSHHLAKQLHCRDGPGCCSSRGILSLTTVPDGIFSPLSPHYLPPTPTFSALFRCNNFMSVSFIEAIALAWSSTSNSYCKKDYSKGEVN